MNLKNKVNSILKVCIHNISSFKIRILDTIYYIVLRTDLGVSWGVCIKPNLENSHKDRTSLHTYRQQLVSSNFTD